MGQSTLSRRFGLRMVGRFSGVRLVTVGLLCFLGGSLAKSAEAQTYTFTSVLDNTNTTAPDGTALTATSYAAVSGNTAVFSGFYKSFQSQGVFTVGTSGGAYTTEATTSTTAPNGAKFTDFYHPIAISGNTVAYIAAYGSGGFGLFTESTNGGSYTSIANTSTTAPSGSTFGVFLAPSISGSLVAFDGRYGSSQSGLFVSNANGGSYTTLATTSTIASDGTAFSSFSPPSINGTMVVFTGLSNSGNTEGLYTMSASGGSYTTLATSNTLAPDGTTLTLNTALPRSNGSTVVFESTYNSGKSDGVFATSASGGGYTTLVTTSAVAPGGTNFTNFYYPAITNNMAVFQGNYTVNGNASSGIFVERTDGTGGYSSAIKDGDSLFGSTVTAVSFSPADLDSSGNFTFSYSLANGKSGLAVGHIGDTAAAPEPSSVALAGLFGVGGVWLRRKRRARRYKTA